MWIPVVKYWPLNCLQALSCTEPPGPPCCAPECEAFLPLDSDGLVALMCGSLHSQKEWRLSRMLYPNRKDVWVPALKFPRGLGTASFV